MFRKYYAFLLLLFVQAIAFNLYSQKQLSQYTPPQSWTTYKLGFGSCSLSIPPTMELRKNSDSYTQDMNASGMNINANNIVFQQEGLGRKSAESTTRFARIIINYSDGSSGDYLKKNETTPIDDEMKRSIKASVYQGIHRASQLMGEVQLISGPIIRWISISGTKALEVVYRRTGADNTTTTSHWYMLQNDNKAVYIEVSSRDQDAEYFQPALSNVIRTFKWK